MFGLESSYVLYIRSQYALNDGRLMRYLSFMQSNRLRYKVFCWDRSLDSKNNGYVDEHIENYLAPAKTGGRYSNLFKLLLWNVAIFRYCLKNKRRIKKIHCIDFDSIFPCFLFSKLYSTPLIFDSYDRYSDSRLIKRPFKPVVDWIETYILQEAEIAILPAACRIEQYKLKDTSNLAIIENVPSFSNVGYCQRSQLNNQLERIINRVIEKSSYYRAVLSYVGVLEPEHRGLENLLNCMADFPDLALIVAGDGPLRAKVLEAASDNIFYVGSLEYRYAQQIMAFSDLHVGLYYLSNPNHKFAAPNKYYEHLYFGKALLTSKNTPPGDLVEQFSTGFVIDDSSEALYKCLQGLDPTILQRVGSQAREHWLSHYLDYHTKVFESTYRRVVEHSYL
jgi:glycosyltransferase involved in cell wall biosynthesis